MKSNKSVKAMLWSLYSSEFWKECEKNLDEPLRRVWAFDRLRLVESGFDRKKLRFSQFSLVSLDASGNIQAVSKG